LLDTSVLTVTGANLGENLDWWAKSERRQRFRTILGKQDGVDADDVIMSAERAARRGLTNTITFPRGNIAPEGAVIKSTSIDRSVIGSDGVFRKEGPACVFVRETDAIAAIKKGLVRAGDVVVLAGCGPIGTGMEETYQLTSALKHLPFGKDVALITDARFSGVSTGACIGHVGPEALAGGPIGKLRDGDLIRIVIDCRRLKGSVDLVGDGQRAFTPEEGARVLATRDLRTDLAPAKDLPEDTRLWAALQQTGGGTWGGCVYDAEAVIDALQHASR
jgi:dihydroxyacid dehydratase/phosphogluconate dehydratase